MILEVSQKQAYIFGSIRLRDNIACSNQICQVTDPAYFSLIAAEAGLTFSEEEQVVYSGGGHTVLEFPDKERAKAFAFAVSARVKQEFPEIELFIRIHEYNEAAGPGENLRLLSESLERKKSLRRSAFQTKSFGIERIDAAVRRAVWKTENKKIPWKEQKEYLPNGFTGVKSFDELGNRKNDSSFIAVVHIDGNAMGKRVDAIRKQNEKADWTDYKKVLDQFSKGIAADFTAAYQEMADRIADQIMQGKLADLDLETGSFPVRSIILAGDDVCFVTEGRIGLESARIFIEQLTKKKNQVDHKPYAACAGVAIVHQKYPFYKAYELAEMLCSNAKKMIAGFNTETLDAAAECCAIDWHIEYGEVADNLSELRRNYTTNDGKRLELRPYILSGPDAVMKKEPVRLYCNFSKFMAALKSQLHAGQNIDYAKGKLKELRGVLKEGEESAHYYMKSNVMDDIQLSAYHGIFREFNLNDYKFGEALERRIFVETADGVCRSLYFDGIEMLDTYLALQ